MNIKLAIETWFRFLFCKNFCKKKSKSLLSYFMIPPNNYVNIVCSKIMRSKIVVSGIGNTIGLETILNKSTIQIEGNNNKIIVRRGSQLHSLFLSIAGDNCVIDIGENVFFHSGFLHAGGKNSLIQIGNDCLFAHDIDIMNSDSHQILSDGKEVNYSKDVIIGKHVWVGAHVSIMKGVSIGNNSIIGIRSVVTKDIKDNTLNVGIPCRLIKEGVNWSSERNTK